MGKFSGLVGKGKNLGKNMMAEGMPIVLTTAGVIAGQKFLDFKSLFPNAKPDSFFIKHEGMVKLGGAILALAMFRKLPMPVRFLIAGVGIQGGIKAARQYTMSDAGKAFFDQIGQNGGEYDSEINEAAKKILDFAANTSNTGVGAPQGGSTSRVLQNYSNTGIAGMGYELDDLAA